MRQAAQLEGWSWQGLGTIPAVQRPGNRATKGGWGPLGLVLAGALVAVLVACNGGPSGGAPASGSVPSSSRAAAERGPAPGSGAADRSAAPIPLNYAYTGPSAAFTPAWVAEQEGYFREEGLAVTLTSVQPVPGMQALIAGDFQIESTGPQVVDARLGGADAVYIADLVPYFVFDVYAQPELRDAAALKGGTIGATQAGATTDFAAQAYAKRVGLTPGQDLQVQYVGSMPGLLASLQNRLIHAAILSAPTTLAARKAGFTRLVALADLKLPFEHAAMIASRAWVERNQDAVRRFLRAYTRGIATTRDNPSVAMTAIAHYTEVTDPEELRESYEAFKDVFPRRPVVSRDAVRGVLEYATDPRARDLDVASLIYDALVP